ncbi:uncharacterized protein LOC124876526 isoform X2 [Girardinichthys multiradiatus]|uniref:uncharacterized protein LOC124876526 isoform X2 n=1 Tax=Girardinichthys multiradiatus TaxID=208333 RepID=UPI001FACEF2E|nr:uncharacterized protein LOC124876526 isoform X2 [Girardinichthys multiradiatus]
MTCPETICTHCLNFYLKGEKKKRNGACSKPEKKRRRSSAGFQKNNVVNDSDSSDDESQNDDPEHLQSDKKIEIPSWRTSIKNLKNSGDTDKKPIIAKVVQKSGLRTYETKTKEKKFFFYLGVADETDCIKVMVYGKERFKSLEEGRTYLFRKVLMDKEVMKVTKKTIFSKTRETEVSKDLELQTQMLVYNQSPVCSIMKIQSFDEMTSVVSVEGTVTEISVEQVKLKRKRTKEKMIRFQLKDKTGSIWITLWRKDMEQLRETSVGDFVKVINVKTSRYHETVYLNSTDFTRICKVQSAPVQNVTIEIVGIIKSGRMESELEVLINNQVNTFIIASPLLAEVLGVRLADDLEDRLLEKIPFLVQAEIQGNKITDLKAAEEM